MSLRLQKQFIAAFILASFLLFQSSDSLDFSRPLRSRGTNMEDHPAGRDALSPFYREGDMRNNANSLLNERDLNRPLTRHYINHYTSPNSIRWLQTIIDRGGPYLAFIRNEIRELGLPEELLYLPIIESEFLSTAVSRSGAMGIWQFMTNSISPFDMRVTDWMDERRDFWKSTQGALRKLKDNYNFFGDWALALAAYNAGLGAINRFIQQAGTNDYWTLADRRILRTETIHYVPKLLAVSYVMSNPRKYGITSWAEDPLWTRIPLDRQIDLNILAAETGISAMELLRSNQELTFSITPPGNYMLKATAENAVLINEVLARGLPLINYYIHTIRSGDTLLALARHYGVTVDQILTMNSGVHERTLRIGSILMIPAIRDVRPMPAVTAAEFNFSGRHTVQQGETLWAISHAHGISPEILAEANGMKINDILSVGRVLRTPIR